MIQSNWNRAADRHNLAALEGLVNARLSSPPERSLRGRAGDIAVVLRWVTPLLIGLLLVLLLGAAASRPCVAAAMPSWLHCWLAVEWAVGNASLHSRSRQAGSRDWLPDADQRSAWAWIFRGFLLAVVVTCLAVPVASNFRESPATEAQTSESLSDTNSD